MQFEISCPNIYYNIMLKQKYLKQINIDETVLIKQFVRENKQPGSLNRNM